MAKILVIDDDPDLVDAVITILEKKKHEAIPAYGGIEGLEKVKKDRPDAIILDVMMPDKNGYEVCKEIKADSEYREIPILLLTAVAEHIHTTSYTHRMGMETEADDYVAKPVEPSELVRRIEKLLAK